MQASALLLCWGSYRWARNLWVLIVFFIFPRCYVALCASKARHRLGSESVSWCLETSLFLRFPSRDGAPSLPLLSHFCLLYFFLRPFEDNGLLFWVPDVLYQHSEVVLWNLLGEFVGEKVVSPSYSSAILAPPPTFLF